MNRTLLLNFLILTISLSFCHKDSISKNSGVSYGIYSGKKIYFNSTAAPLFIDTITFTLDSLKYSYYGSYSMDYGSGIFKINQDTIDFSDQVARDAMYMWSWIISGKFRFTIVGDSLFLDKSNLDSEIHCKLKRINK